MVKDMTKGNPTKLIVSFAVPMIFGNIFQQLYSIADSLILGRGVGANALAAAGSTGMITWFILGFITGLTQGYGIWISRCFGAGNIGDTRKAITNGAWLSLFASVLLTVISYAFSAPLLKVMRTPADIYDDALLYLRIIIVGTLANIAYNYCAKALGALGDSISPLVIVIISTAINIGLDILFVIVWGWGVAGAAWATVISQAASALLCLVAMRRISIFHMDRHDWKLNKWVMWQMMRLGLPVGFMNSVTAIGGLMLQGVVNTMGSVTVAAYTIGMRIMGIIETPTMLLGNSLGTFVGQNMGARKPERVRKGTRSTIIMSLGVSAVIGVCMIVFGRQIAGVFFADAVVEVINQAYQMIAIGGGMIWALGFLFVYRFALQGMGETKLPMLSGFLELALRLGCAYLLPREWGFLRICIAEVAAWAGAAIMLAVFYYYKLSKERQIAKEAESGLNI